MRAKSKKGIIMIVVLLLMPICLMLGAVMFTNILSERQNLRYERDRGQSFYLAELGLNAGYYSFSESTFTGFTHTKDNDETDPNEAGTAVTGSASLTVADTITNRIPFVRAADGWYQYTWNDTSAHASLTGTGERESIRFRVSRTYDGTVPLTHDGAWLGKKLLVGGAPFTVTWGRW